MKFRLNNKKAKAKNGFAAPPKKSTEITNANSARKPMGTFLRQIRRVSESTFKTKTSRTNEKRRQLRLQPGRYLKLKIPLFIF